MSIRIFVCRPFRWLSRTADLSSLIIPVEFEEDLNTCIMIFSTPYVNRSVLSRSKQRNLTLPSKSSSTMGLKKKNSVSCLWEEIHVSRRGKQTCSGRRDRTVQGLVVEVRCWGISSLIATPLFSFHHVYRVHLILDWQSRSNERFHAITPHPRAPPSPAGLRNVSIPKAERKCRVVT